MLRKLTVENFLSIRESQTLDLTISKKATDPDDRFFDPTGLGEERLPKVVIIYGANAAGKTNVLKALAFLKWFVSQSADASSEIVYPFMPFGGSEWPNLPTNFKIEFYADPKRWGDLNWDDNWSIDDFPPSRMYRFVYELALNSLSDRVIEETLSYYPKSHKRRLFRRKLQSIELGSDFRLSKNDPVIKTKKVRASSSLIATLALFNHPFSTGLARFFNAVQTNLDVFGRKKIIDEDSINQLYRKNDILFQSMKNDIKSIDLGIQDVEYDEGNDSDGAWFRHIGLDYPLLLLQESQGTQHYFRTYPNMWIARSLGTVAVMDELHNDMHPFVLGKILQQFRSGVDNPESAQLIMSNHDVSLLHDAVKEEIFFVEKNTQSATEIFGLKDVKGVRRDSNLYAQYLTGAFGGVPVLG